MEQFVELAWLDIVVHYDETAPEPPRRIGQAPAIDNSAAHWALAFGLVSLVPTVSLITLPVSLPFAVLALVLGALGLRSASRTNDRGRRRALIGMFAAALPLGMALALGVAALAAGSGLLQG